MDLLCVRPFNGLRINCLGDMFLCCYQRERGVGNLLRESFHDIWFGQTVKDIRADVMARRQHALCRVEGCPLAYKRKALFADTSIRDLPTTLEVDLPNVHCNIGGHSPTLENPACIMCERGIAGYRFQTENYLTELLPQLAFLMPQLECLHVQGVAEAFWQRAIFNTLDSLGFDKDIHRAAVCTYTNGWLLSPEVIAEFLDRCPRSSVTFSVDAGTNATYQKIRTKPVYDLVIKNLQAYSRLRRNYPESQLNIHNTISIINLHEINEMVRVAHEVGVDRLSLGAVMGGHCESIRANAQNAQRFYEAEQKAVAEAKRLGVKLSIQRPLNSYHSVPF